MIVIAAVCREASVNVFLKTMGVYDIQELGNTCSGTLYNACIMYALYMHCK